MTLKFFVPNSSEVVETAMEVIAPVHTPITAVLMYKEMVVVLRSMKKAPVIGAISVAIHAVLETAYLLLEK